MRRVYLFSAATVVGLILFGLAIGLALHSARSPLAESVAENDHCDLAQSACQVVFPDLEIQAVFVETPHYMQPVRLNVTAIGTAAADITAVQVQLSMSAMSMSVPSPSLVLHPQTDVQTNHWHGRVMFPVCSSGRHDWLLGLQLQSSSQRYRARFRLSMQATSR